ncbi:hypothetical protein [Nitrososphaera sp.]|uniref:hypothetical protein n=1 Tax=Nitrososphaera sp. TaxID=1971748 RepID=UPI002ED8A7DF
MSRTYAETSVHEQSYLVGELESLGFSSVRLNELNDNSELRSLVERVKENFLEEYRES